MPGFSRTARLCASAVAASALLAACNTTPPPPATGPMGFFITSVGTGNGANLGGLAGADAHCQRLAAAAGAGSRTWRAYLSTSSVAATAPAQPAPAVHARDRIGAGPWFNAKGVLIARSLEELHGKNNLLKATALTEKGAVVNGRGDTPNQHDILTGSRPDGTAFAPVPDMTCGGWMLSGAEGMAMTGHHDRAGLTTDAWSLSWNSSHATRGGCSQDALRGTGGAGLFYCFAAN